MARPIKKELDAFLLSASLFDDPRTRDLLTKHGSLGLGVYLSILCHIAKNGYFWRTSFAELQRTVCEDVGGKWVRREGFVSLVVGTCVELGLFCAELASEGVFTSEEVQRAYIKVRARSKSEITAYCLINVAETGINVAITPINVTETPINVAKTPFFAVSASKTGVNIAETPIIVAETEKKKSREKEKKKKKQKEIKKESPKEKEGERIAHTRETAPTYQDVREYAEKHDYPVATAERFYSYYRAQGWKTSAGIAIRDWRAKIDMWAEEDERKKESGVDSFDVEDAVRINMERSYGSGGSK